MYDTYMLINVYAIRSSNGSSPGVANWKLMDLGCAISL